MSSDEEGETLATVGHKEQLPNSVEFSHILLLEYTLRSDISGNNMNITISTSVVYYTYSYLSILI